MRSGVVLAGGASTRFSDGDKSLAALAGRPLVQHVVDSLGAAVDELVVVGRSEDQAERLNFLDADIAVDEVKGFGPVAGIQAGFSWASGDVCFLAACDTPLIRSRLVELLFEMAEGFRGAVPSNSHLEPLTAVYRRRPTVEAAEAAIERGDSKIIELYGDIGPIRLVPKEDLRGADPDLSSFLNVNTVEDLEAAGRRLEELI
ncbi:MAG: Molybdenum cofactor guanylyltransferase [Methanonatronarchaeales archaeon]|nr:Molybdenum cofactor guanylyltransferase [Methanonatronarchaeales archaeon]